MISDPEVVVPIAVIVVVPAPTPTAVAKPFLSIVATETSLEDQFTVVVKSWTTEPLVRLPSAMNCVVSPVKPAAALPGMMVMDGAPEPAPEELDATTVMSVSAVVPPDVA